MAAPTLPITIQGSTIQVPDLTKVFNTIRGFNFGNNELQETSDKLKNELDALEVFVSQSGITVSTALNSIVGIQNAIENLGIELENVDYTALTELNEVIGSVRPQLEYLNTIFGYGSGVAASNIGIDALTGQWWVTPTQTIAGSPLIRIPMTTVIDTLEETELDLASISPALAGIESSLESIGIVGAVVGGVVAASDILGTLLTKLISLIQNAWFGKPPVLAPYISTTGILGTVQTTPKTGFMKIMKDFSKSQMHNWTNNYFIAAAMIGVRDFSVVMKELYAGASTFGQTYSEIEILKSISTKDVDFISTVPDIDPAIANLEKTYEKLTSELLSLFTDMNRIGTMPFINTVDVLKQFRYSARGWLVEDLPTDEEVKWEGRRQFSVYQQLQFVYQWMIKVYNLIDSMNAFKTSVDAIYLTTIASYVDFERAKEILPIVLTIPPTETVVDQGVITDPSITDSMNKFPITDINGLINGLIDLEAIRSITDTVSQSVTKTKTKESKKKKKKPKKKKDEERKETEKGHIIRIDFNIDPFSEKFQYLEFKFDSPSKESANTFGKIILIRKDGKRFTLGKANRGAFSKYAIKTIKHESVKIKDATRSIPLAQAKKYIDEEIDNKQYFTYT